MTNVNPNYFLYTKSFNTTVIDRETGISYAASFAYKTPATDAIFDTYRPFGGVGYLDTEYNVYRIDETGEEFVYPFSFGYANPEEVMEIWRTRNAAKAVEAVTPAVKHDGLDNLREQLSDKVSLKIEKQSNDVIVLIFSVPDPVQLHPSLFAKAWMTTPVIKRYVWADSNRRVLPPAYSPTILSLEAWEQDIRERAGQMLKNAQNDPVAFFRED